MRVVIFLAALLIASGAAAGPRVGSGGSGSSSGGVFFFGQQDTNETEITAPNGTFDVMDISLAAEVADTTSEFTISASDDEVCYAGTDSITVDVDIALSFERTTGAATDTMTAVIGKDTTGAIGNGDEIGRGFQRTITTANVIGMGDISASTVLVTDECLSVMMMSSTVGASGITMRGVAISITEPGTAGGSAIAFPGGSADTQILFNSGGLIEGTSNATLDAAGLITASSFVSTAADGSRGITMVDNPTGGYTAGAPSGTGGGILHMSSFDGTLRPWLQDEANASHEISVFNTDGSLRDPRAGQSEADGTSDSWAIDEVGDTKIGKSLQMWALDTTTWYAAARFFADVTDATVDAEVTQLQLRVLGYGLSNAKRMVIDSAGLVRFGAGDGLTGIGIHKGADTSFYTRLYTPSSLAANTSVGFPLVSGTIALDAGNTEDAATETLLASEMYGGFFVATANAFVYTLPAGVVGMNGCFWARTAAVITIDPDASDQIYLNGSGVNGDGNSIDSSGAIGDSLCLRADSAGDWMIYAEGPNAWGDTPP